MDTFLITSNPQNKKGGCTAIVHTPHPVAILEVLDSPEDIKKPDGRVWRNFKHTRTADSLELRFTFLLHHGMDGATTDDIHKLMERASHWYRALLIKQHDEARNNEEESPAPSV